MPAKATVPQTPSSSKGTPGLGASTKRGRPSLAQMADRGDTRIGLLRAARKLMIDSDGVDFTLMQLATLTGQSPALVKYHFGNKEGLLLALIEWDATTALTAMMALRAKDLPVEQKMRMHIRGMIDAYFKAPYANRLLQALVQSSAPESATHVSDTFMKPVAAFQAELLARGLREGVFKAIEPIEFFFIVVGSCDHFFSRRSVMAHVFGVTEIDRDLKNRYCNTLTEIILAGIAPEATPSA